jgi:hypothetical protein
MKARSRSTWLFCSLISVFSGVAEQRSQHGPVSEAGGGAVAPQRRVAADVVIDHLLVLTAENSRATIG